MLTNNILPLKDINDLAGPLPVSRLEGVKKTIAWLIDTRDIRSGADIPLNFFIQELSLCKLRKTKRTS